MVTFFASGSNHSGEIRALSLVPGANVGVVAAGVDRNHAAAAAELDRFADSGRKVFIDSGAFSEIEFGPDGPRVVRPLTDEHWANVFAVYAERALVHGKDVYAVAPDMVGFQAESLERLAEYAEDVRNIRALGATVLVPVQKGVLPMAEFWETATGVLGEDDYVPAIPMKKDATSLADLAEFCRTVQPGAIHLLGVAPDSKRGQAAIATVQANAPGCEISCDACLIKRWVGRGKQPRRLTALNDLHVSKLAADPPEHEVHVRKALSLFLAASVYWTDNGLAPLPEYVAVNPPADCWNLEPAYLPLATALWGVEASRPVRQGTLFSL